MLLKKEFAFGSIAEFKDSSGKQFYRLKVLDEDDNNYTAWLSFDAGKRFLNFKKYQPLELSFNLFRDKTGAYVIRFKV